MEIGDRIKALRKSKKITQSELAKISGTAKNTISQYELGLRKPRLEQLLSIASALGTTVNEITGPRPDSFYWLNQKLHAIGYSYDFYEEDAFLWLVYPDGTLEVNVEQLLALNNECDEFLRFKLEELKRKNASDFKAKK